MKDKTTTDGRLHWIKFNPTEWLGICDGMSDAEFGMFHRVLAKCWATPGNTIPLDDLKRKLRIRDSDDRDDVLKGLLGFVLENGPDGVTIPQLQEAFNDAVNRSESGKKAAKERWGRKAEEVPSAGKPLSDDDEFESDIPF
jgi:uncharacterized protein YdaU (DUF1376 family)